MKYKYQETETKKLVRDFNKRYCFVVLDSELFVYDLIEKKFRKLKTFQTLHSNRFYSYQNQKDKVTVCKASKIWEESKKRNTAENTIFDPSKSPGFKKKKKVLNLWQGLKPLNKNRVTSWSLMKDHILNVICNGNKKHYKYLIQWLARVVQDPGGERPGVAIALYGKKGTGKGFFITTFGELFKPHFIHLSTKEDLVGKFTSHLAESVLVFADEVIFPGNKNHEGRLKAIITEPTFTKEEKFQPRISIANHMNIMISSNEEWFIPATMDERRFLSLEVADTHIKDFKYFEAIRNQMNNGGLEAMYFELIGMKVDLNFLRKAPRTKLLKAQARRGFNSVEAFHYNLKKGEISLSDLSGDGRVLKKQVFIEYMTFKEQNALWRYEGKGASSFWVDFYKLCPFLNAQSWKNKKGGSLKPAQMNLNSFLSMI